MLLVHRINKKFDRKYLNQNRFNINLKKKSKLEKEYDIKTKIADLTYNLFSNNKNFTNKIKIKKIETSFIDEEKMRNKKQNIIILTDFRKKEKNNSIKKNSNSNNNSELIKHKKINKVNSLIININNNKNDVNSLQNSKLYQTRENFINNNKNLENKNLEYFYDYSLTKNDITENEFKKNSNFFNSYYLSTFNTMKINNYKKIKIKLNKKNIRDKLNLGFSSKKPIKIKRNLEKKNKSYITKKNSEKSFINKSINNESKHSNIFMNKHFYSKSFNTTKKISKNKNFLNLTQKDNKIAEKNYLEKWQLMNGIKIDKKHSLSYINSKKKSKIPQNYLILEKNNAFSQRQRKNKSIDSINFQKINEANENIYNKTEINKKFENHIDIFKNKNNEKNNKNNEIIFNNTNLSINHSNEIENQQEYNDENINKIIERKKREIDLLNVMKFTSKLNNTQFTNNYDNIDNNNMNLNYFNNYSIL